MDLRQEIAAAADAIRDSVLRTPLERSPSLSAATGCEVYLKLENQQRTGSFKLRGAMNKLHSLAAETRARGVVAASTGNHGAAVACGAAALGTTAQIFAPQTAAPSKLAAIESYGGTIRFAGEDCVESELAARAHAEAAGLAYVSPYNDPMVVAGQGTVGLEIAEQLPDVDAVVVSVGGGGLVGGIGGYFAGGERPVRILATSPRNSAVMEASLRAGEVLDLPSEPTLSDGTAGGLEMDSITFGICRDVIDDFVLVSEEAIADGVRRIVRDHHMLVEGAAGTAVAALLERAPTLAGQKVAVVLCGANIDVDVLKGLL